MPPIYRGALVDRTSLSALAAKAASGDDGARDIVSTLYTDEVLRLHGHLEGCEGFGSVEQRWHDESDAVRERLLAVIAALPGRQEDTLDGLILTARAITIVVLLEHGDQSVLRRQLAEARADSDALEVEAYAQLAGTKRAGPADVAALLAGRAGASQVGGAIREQREKEERERRARQRAEFGRMVWRAIGRTLVVSLLMSGAVIGGAVALSFSGPVPEPGELALEALWPSLAMNDEVRHALQQVPWQGGAARSPAAARAAAHSVLHVGQNACASDSVSSVPEAPLLSVREAAERLGVGPVAVRQHIASGRLPAVKRGRSWWLDERAVRRMARQRLGGGRPLSPAMAWAVLLLASGDESAAEEIAGRNRYWSRMRAWLRDHPLGEYAPRLRTRAKMEEFDVHPSELKRVLDRPDVLVTGISASETIGLLGPALAVEVYAPAGHRRAIVDEHALSPAAGPVRIRWVLDEVWPVLSRGEDRRAPRAAILLDLLESDEPRARREAARALA